MSRGYIIGFVITPRTLGARLLFPDRDTWAVWAQDDNEVASKEPSQASGANNNNNQKQRPPHRNNKSEHSTTTDDYSTSMVQSIDLAFFLVLI